MYNARKGREKAPTIRNTACVHVDGDSGCGSLYGCDPNNIHLHQHTRVHALFWFYLARVSLCALAAPVVSSNSLQVVLQGNWEWSNTAHSFSLHNVECMMPR